MLIVRPAAARTGAEAPHPQVAVLDIDGRAECPFAPANRALILDNLASFLTYDATEQFLERYCKFALNDTDVIYADGRTISNAQHHDFLQQYESIAFWLDFDLRGFDIAVKLAQLLPQTNFSFLLPHDMEERLERVPQRLPINQLYSLLMITRPYPFLAEAAQLMAKYNRPLKFVF